MGEIKICSNCDNYAEKAYEYCGKILCEKCLFVEWVKEGFPIYDADKLFAAAEEDGISDVDMLSWHVEINATPELHMDELLEFLYNPEEWESFKNDYRIYDRIE